MERTRSFFTAFVCSMAGFVWLLGGEVSALGGLIAVAIPVIGWWLPWHKWRVARRVAIALGAGLGAVGAVGLLADTVCAFLPLWQIILGIILFTALLVYIGREPLRRASILLGGVTAAGILLLCLCALPMASGGVRVAFHDAFYLPLGGLAMLGGGLTALECRCQRRAARWGGIAGAGLYLCAAFAALAVWSPAAVARLGYPILSAFRRVDLFSLIFCPDIMLAAAVALCAMLQWSAALRIVFPLQKNK